MEPEYVTKSRLYLENHLPGGVIRLRNQAYAKVVGTRSGHYGVGEIDEQQLLEAAGRFVLGWDAAVGGAVAAGLLQAVAERDLVVRSPVEVYVLPFPLMLQCETCKVVDFYDTRRSDTETVDLVLQRVVRRGGRPYVQCKRSGCSGAMRQIPFMAVHRCGFGGPITVPHAARRKKNIQLREQGGSFFNNAWHDLDTGERLAIALQDHCTACRNIHGGDAATGKRGTPITGGESFYAQTIQYIALSQPTAALVGELLARVTSAGGVRSGPGSDIAEGIASGLLGRVDGTSLAAQLRSLLDEVPGGQNLDDIREKLEKKKKARDKYATKAADDDDMAEMLASIEKEIEALTEQLNLATGRFKSVRAYLDDDMTLSALASERRAMESIFLRKDYVLRDYEVVVAEEPDAEERDLLAVRWRGLQDRYGVLSASHIPNLKVVLSTVGFTRERRSPLDGFESGDVPVTLNGFEEQYDESLRGKTAIYAMSASTEAILLRLDPCAVLRWCVEGAGWTAPVAEALTDPAAARAHLLTHSAALRAAPSNVRSVAKERHPAEAAPFHLLHTISHCLLQTARRHSGYDSRSLMEYLLPMDLAVLVYVTSVQDYTSGGLLSLFKHSMPAWFADASLYAFTCAFDPLCSDRGGSCSGCVEVPLACETFNHGMSRSYIHGGAARPELGIVISRGFWDT